MTTHWIKDVADFHRMTDTPISHVPSIPSNDRAELRWSLVDEEINRELKPALDSEDIVEIADAIADSIYVLVGMALEYGIPLQAVWDEVQRSNMAKQEPGTGKVKRRADGKILKPDGWTPPNIKQALGLIRHVFVDETDAYLIREGSIGL